MRDDGIDAHDVGIFVVQIEQVDLVRDPAAIEAALLDQRNVEPVGVGFHFGCAHASRGASSTYDDRLHAQLCEMGDERRAEKTLARNFGMTTSHA